MGKDLALPYAEKGYIHAAKSGNASLYHAQLPCATTSLRAGWYLEERNNIYNVFYCMQTQYMRFFVYCRARSKKQHAHRLRGSARGCCDCRAGASRRDAERRRSRRRAEYITLSLTGSICVQD